ncbi:hypothetical protein J7382_06535 [Shimia sp. R11_0]|uniref:Uncharacterized protein n=1 Tax=Shimia marina TaxID=321267 RepID=A0A0P1EP98_9RHOB|nr:MULTISPECIES: hypothetical protein [Shimia]MBO9477184.1 hypothetical protein [Shimia sp. R11_0]CUH51974.1 hypothetical protein SHM7688_01414 [Shimia marina]SFE77926.1 hypothetical protein SAMN04488037_1213 [Shimia marina]
MKQTLALIFTVLGAAPALAHAEGSFHTHGAELFLLLAVLVVLAGAAFKSMK